MVAGFETERSEREPVLGADEVRERLLDDRRGKLRSRGSDSLESD